MRKDLIVAATLVVLSCVPNTVSRAASPEKVSAEGGCPTITHVPLISVPRGVPAAISAKIECPTGSVTKVTLYVRATDAGKPSPMNMSGNGDGVYEATVPLSMIEGLSRFWYYIDARGALPEDGSTEGIAQTRWHPVTIIEHAEFGGGGAGHKGAYLWLGGLGAAIATYLIVDNNDGGGGGGQQGATGSGNMTPPPSGGGGNDGGDSTGGGGGCTTTGNENASAAPSVFCNQDDISIFICNTCPDATVEAVGDWGAMASRSGYNGGGCDPGGAPALTLSRPPNGEPAIGEFSISVRANGHEIAVLSWPDAGFYDCGR